MLGTALRVLLQLIAVLWLALAAVAMAQEVAIHEGVLILHSNQRPLAAGIIIDDTLRKVVSGALGRPVEIYSEFLDNERFSPAEYTETLSQFLRQKYSERNVRVIFAIAPPAFRFVLDHRVAILPDALVVHVSLPRDLLPTGGLPQEFAGATLDLDPMSTFELALRLQPGARHLVIVTGADNRDRIWDMRIRDAVERLGDRLEVEYLKGLPTADLLHRLSTLARDTIVYTPGYFADGTGRITTPRQSVEQMAAASTAPLYGPNYTFLGAGAVGGVTSPYEDQAREAGAIAVRLLNGTAPKAIAASSMPNVPIVDWRQLRRWGMDEKLLPPNAIVQFREQSVWDAYRREILIGIVVVLLQATLIVALLIQRRARQRIATELDESKQRMSLAARSARISMWVWDVARDKVWIMPRSLRQPGAPDEQPIEFSEFIESVHRSDRDNVRRAARESLATNAEFDTEYRVTGRDGEVRWIAARGRAEQGKNNQRLVGVAIDISARKRAELQAAQDRAALSYMTRVSVLGQLSASIAHELNQPLAAILGNAEAARKMLTREQVDLAELRDICDDIVSEDHRAVRVIRRLRDLYKHGEIDLEAIDVNVLIRETLDLVSTELLTRHVTTVTDLAASLPPINAGRVQLQQVLLNLILNAADAMSGNAEHDRTVTICSEAAVENIRLSVVDRGPGIAAADAKNIFNAFWTTKAGGMGMGLAISQSIVAAHRGTLTAVNNADRGATFCVTLPVRAQA